MKLLGTDFMEILSLGIGFSPEVAYFQAVSRALRSWVSKSMSLQHLLFLGESTSMTFVKGWFQK